MNKLTFHENVRYPTDEGKTSRRISLPHLVAHIQREALTKRQQEFFILYYSENKKIPEIAEQLGINKSTVSRTLKRGMAKLKRYLSY